MMSEYTLVIRIPQAGNKEISYSINLSGLHESYPEDYFRQENHRFHICQTIEQQSARKVDVGNLSLIVSNWISDIKVGRHRTIVTLDLPLDSTIALESVVTSSQTIAAPAKQPLTSPTSVVKPAKTPNTIIQNSPKTDPAETPAEKPKTSSLDIRADSNKADF